MLRLAPQSRGLRSARHDSRRAHAIAVFSFAIFVFAAARVVAQAPAELRGRVISDSTREPIERAQVLVPALGLTTQTDEDGRYRLTGLHGNTYVVVALLPGFRPDTARLTIGDGEVVLRDFVLRRPQVAAPVVAEPTLAPALVPLTVREPEAGSRSLRIVRGTVSDSAGRPVPEATVLVKEKAIAQTDSAGEFRVELPDRAAVALDIRRLGFRPSRVHLGAGPDTSIGVAMLPLAQSLPEVKVERERSGKLEIHGFYRRMADRAKGINTAHFITQEEIEKRNPTRLMQLLENINGVRVGRSGSCNIHVRCWVPKEPSGCFMSVFLDGQRLNRLALDANTDPWGGSQYPDELIIPTSVAGIEVYSRVNQVPPQYQSLGGCGVILVWTR